MYDISIKAVNIHLQQVLLYRWLLMGRASPFSRQKETYGI